MFDKHKNYLTFKIKTIVNNLMLNNKKKEFNLDLLKEQTNNRCNQRPTLLKK